MILGAVLFGAEMIAIDAQFYLVFLGVSAAIVGLLGLTGLVMPEWAQWLVFAVLSLISMFTFRRSVYEKIRGGALGFRDGVEGDFIVIQQELAPREQARANFRGSDWTVVNESAAAISAGTRARITRSEGLTLYISAENQ
jgi:membrane protein implicated in regulation of membrane protease activity